MNGGFCLAFELVKFMLEWLNWFKSMIEFLLGTTYSIYGVSSKLSFFK